MLLQNLKKIKQKIFYNIGKIIITINIKCILVDV